MTSRPSRDDHAHRGAVLRADLAVQHRIDRAWVAGGEQLREVLHGDAQRVIARPEEVTLKVSDDVGIGAATRRSGRATSAAPSAAAARLPWQNGLQRARR